MSKAPQPHFVPVPATRLRTRFTGWLGGTLIKLWYATLRIHVEDPAGWLDRPPAACIWTFWHNRIFVVPAFFHRRVRPVRPAAVLTSPSGDGAILAAVMSQFRMTAVRGSSNKRAAQALVECRRLLQRGYTLGITPDGPRGPRYQLAPGVVQLSRVAACPILPVRLHLHNKWELKSWDRFQIPRPFSRVTITLCPEVHCAGREIEDARAEVERILGGDI